MMEIFAIARRYVTQMQQCKAEAEKEHPKYKGFHDLSEPHMEFTENSRYLKNVEFPATGNILVLADNTKIISNQMAYIFENEHLLNSFDAGECIELK